MLSQNTKVASILSSGAVSPHLSLKIPRDHGLVTQGETHSLTDLWVRSYERHTFLSELPRRSKLWSTASQVLKEPIQYVI